MEPGYLNSVASMDSGDPDNVTYPFKEKHLWVKRKNILLWRVSTSKG